MKKTLNINLGGIAFIIDENAFELLHNYLEALKAKFKNAAERDEILNDIEARIAEMLNQRFGGVKQIVSVEDVQYVTGSLGRPEDIAGEEPAETSATSSTFSYVAETPVKRRLFRDPDDAKVGGVIAGLCHYFGISDPAWVRLAVVILCFVSFGTVLLIYFLLLLVIPKAQTAAEKLQMKGEPVNITTIEKEIRGAVNKAGESVSRLREDSFIDKVWGFIVTIIKGVLKLVAAFIIFIGLIIIFALLAALFGVSFAGNALLAHAPHLLIDNPATLTVFKVGLVLFIAAPVVALVYAALRLIFGKRTQEPRLKWVLIVAWVIGIFLMGYGGMAVGREFSSKATKNETMALMQPANGALYVQLTDSLGNKVSADEDEDEHTNFNIGPGGIIINGTNMEDLERIPIGEPSLQLAASDNDSFYVQKSIITRGRNRGDALTNSGYVIYNLSQTDTVLNLPDRVLLDKTGKYRAQQVKLRIAIPEGKFVSFADNIDRWAATVKGDSNFDDTYFANTTWTNDHGKITCVKGENHFRAEEEVVIERKMNEAADSLDEKLSKAGKHLRRIEKRIERKMGQKDAAEKKDTSADF